MIRRPLSRAVALALDATPDARRRLSEGALVEASVVARLFGVRLLKLNATVALAPAKIRPVSAPIQAFPSRGAARPPPRRRAAALGGRLPDAVRTIDEAAEVLAAARHDGSGVAPERS